MCFKEIGFSKYFLSKGVGSAEKIMQRKRAELKHWQGATTFSRMTFIRMTFIRMIVVRMTFSKMTLSSKGHSSK
jgi:hypothetical protein